MTDLPAPLTTADCDLRGMEWMPLYGDRLFASETWLLASPEGRCAAIALWWAAWKQRPAGSLADNDRVLAQMAGYGMAVKAWQAIRQEAMRGWVQCSDGRLYHPVVCELALDAWARRQDTEQSRDRHKAKMQKWRDAKRDRHISPGEPSHKEDGDGNGDASVTSLTVQDKTGQDIENPLTPLKRGESETNSGEGRTGHGRRSTGTNPRAVAAVVADTTNALKRAEIQRKTEAHALWKPTRPWLIEADFRGFIEKCEFVEAGATGSATLIAPSKFVRDHIRSQWGDRLCEAFGGPITIDVRAEGG